MSSHLTAEMLLAQINREVVANVANELGQIVDHKPRPGGLVVIEIFYSDKPELSTSASVSVGSPGANMHENAYYAHEKIRRLRNFRRQGLNHVASSESADKDKGQYGGAIFALEEHNVEVYISYSGAPQEVDEAISFVLARGFHLLVSDSYVNPIVERATLLLADALR